MNSLVTKNVSMNIVGREHHGAIPNLAPKPILTKKYRAAPYLSPRAARKIEQNDKSNTRHILYSTPYTHMHARLKKKQIIYKNSTLHFFLQQIENATAAGGRTELSNPAGLLSSMWDYSFWHAATDSNPADMTRNAC